MRIFQKYRKALTHRFEKPNTSKAGKTKINLTLGTKKEKSHKDRLPSVSKMRLTAHFSTIIMEARDDGKMNLMSGRKINTLLSILGEYISQEWEGNKPGKKKKERHVPTTHLHCEKV